MTKIAIVADVHFNNYKETVNHIKTETVFDVFSQVLSYCVDHKIKTIKILGDLFHIRGKINVVVFNRVYDLLRDIAVLYGIEIHLLSGNHDMVFNSESSTTSIYTLKHIKGVSVMDNTIKIEGKTAFFSIPYQKTSEDLIKAIVQIQQTPEGVYGMNSEFKVLLTHGTICGSTLSSGTTFTEGIETDGKEFKMFDKIFAGHIHCPQELYGGKAVVVGAPCCHSKKDLNSIGRGFIVYDTETGDYERVETDHPRFLSFTAKDQDELNAIVKDVDRKDFLFIKALTEIVPIEGYNMEIENAIIKANKDSRLDVSLGDTEESIVKNYIEKIAPKEDVAFFNKLAMELLANQVGQL